ncbi:MAG: hypothetical protein LIP11_01740 [Clostridiales bacterium]|nr:hypothetical protein [Clostridiales bacterium]
MLMKAYLDKYADRNMQFNNAELFAGYAFIDDEYFTIRRLFASGKIADGRERVFLL